MTLPPLIYDVSASGHRVRDANIIAKVVSGTVLLDTPKRNFRRLVLHAGPVVWQTADYQLQWFTFVAMLRSLFGRKTIGICYRNNYAADRRFLRRTVRKILFSAWNAFPFCTALTTCPLPSMRRSTKFLYDIEWWDLKAAPLPVVPLSSVGGTAKTLMFLGDTSHLKGIGFFIDCAVAAAERNSEWQFVVVGPIDRLTPRQRERLSDADAALIPGPKDDAAFVSYVRQADLVWCCYDPVYDQSSGIFGRALQLNKATIVRAESLLHAGQRDYGEGIAVSYGDTDGFLAALDRPIEARNHSEDIARIHDQAIGLLREVCG